MGKYTEGSEEHWERWLNCTGVSPPLAQRSMVGSSVTDASCPPADHEGEKSVSRSKRSSAAATQLGNPFHSCERLTGAELRGKLRLLEASNDIPLKQRLFWLQMYKAKVTNSKNMVHIQATARRLKNQGKQAKHLIFPDITSLVSQVFSTNPSNAESLLDSLLLQLRLSTLMRSVDMSQVMWGLLRHDNSFYIKTTDKNAKVQLFNVTDPTLRLLLKYLVNHVQHPGLFLFRHLKQPHLYLSAERLSKRVQKFMQAAGINVQVFKSHSLRGVIATHLLRQGCDKSWVKTRGGWSSMATLDLYYDRLHQTQDWAQLVQGMPVTPAPAMGEHDLGEYRQTASNAAESAKSAYPEATKEAGGEADEQEKAALPH